MDVIDVKQYRNREQYQFAYAPSQSLFIYFSHHDRHSVVLEEAGVPRDDPVVRGAVIVHDGVHGVRITSSFMVQDEWTPYMHCSSTEFYQTRRVERHAIRDSLRQLRTDGCDSLLPVIFEGFDYSTPLTRPVQVQAGLLGDFQ